jgi:hypothetical protein
MMRTLTCLGLAALCFTLLAADKPPEGFAALFNGENLDGWKIPEGDNGHWKVADGVIDYDARSEAKKDKDLWTQKSYKNFVLLVDWRLKEAPFENKNVPFIQPDGTHKKGADGKELRQTIMDADSGIYLRGSSKSQVNIWCWPIGSGEVYGYRMDAKMPAEVRAAVTPKTKADKPIGEWNHFEITLKGDRLWVKLNGTEVITNAQLPGIPESGPIALQHHGGFDPKTGKYTGPPSLVQYRNIFIKELN